MIKNSFLDKYRKKPKYAEIDEQLLKEDDEYILNNSRPLSDKKVAQLPPEKLYKFIEEFLTNKKVCKLLYSTNAKKEVQHFIHSTKVVERNSNYKPKRNVSSDANSIVRNRERMAQFNKIQNEIESFKENKTQKKEALTKKNQNFFYQMKNQRHDQVKLFYKPLNDIRLKSNFISKEERKQFTSNDKLLIAFIFLYSFVKFLTSTTLFIYTIHFYILILSISVIILSKLEKLVKSICLL